MLTTLAKRTAARLPHTLQQALKRYYFRREIRRGTFQTDEPEWALSTRWLSPGDWAIDVGANIGHYTKRFSDLVGPAGRVIAFEPVPATFELLASNAAHFGMANVTLLNLAASDATSVIGMRVIKIDAEGHDEVVVRGAKALITAQRPTIVIESTSKEVNALLTSLGYRNEAVPDSSNVVYRPSP
jgi:precorrin-6B methylase 2